MGVLSQNSTSQVRVLDQGVGDVDSERREIVAVFHWKAGQIRSDVRTHGKRTASGQPRSYNKKSPNDSSVLAHDSGVFQGPNRTRVKG